MKHFILSMLILTASLCAHSQNVTKDAQGNYHALNTSAKADTGKLSGKTYTDSKGIIYPVMVTAKGKLFVMRTSKKTGKTYKQYLKL